MTADDLCRVGSCRIVDFMVHDRAAFGGTLLGLGVVYVWLTVFPLAAGEPWAWWTWLVTGVVGFATFLAYLGYGYLDTWHGLGTLLLAPVFVTGLVRSRSLVMERLDPWTLVRRAGRFDLRSRPTWGRLILRQAVATAGTGSVGAALTVHATVGYTDGWHLAPPLVAAGLLVLGLWAARAPRIR